MVVVVVVVIREEGLEYERPKKFVCFIFFLFGEKNHFVNDRRTFGHFREKKPFRQGREREREGGEISNRKKRDVRRMKFSSIKSFYSFIGNEI